MILTAFDIADELRTLINHNLRGFAHDIRVRVDAHCFHDEIEAVVFCVALRIQERPVLPLGFHFLASDGGDTFLHDFGFLDAPGLVDLGGVHRHTVGARTDDVERSVLFRGSDIEVACHRQLLAFTVFRHFREEAGELDIVACDWIRWEDFAAFDIGEVFARIPVLHFEIFGCDVADLAAVRNGIYFDGVIFELERFIYYVDWYAREPLVQYLIMNSARIDGDA